MAQFLPRVLSTVAKAVITLLLLALLFWKIDYAATLRHLQEITLFTAFAGVAVLIIADVLATVRWRIILRSMGESFTTWRLFRLTFIGLFFNQALPSAIGGDGVRVWLLYRDGCSFARAFNSVLIDRMSGFAILAVMSLYGLPSLVDRLFAIPKDQVIVGIIAIAILAFVLLYGVARAGAGMTKFRLGRFVIQIVADVLFLAKRPGDSAKILLLSLGTQLPCVWLVWIILRDLGASVSLVGVVIVAPVVLLLLVLPISIAGWGLREGLFVVGFGLLNVPQDVALAASIVFGLLNLIGSLIGGPFWIFEPARAQGPMTSSHPTVGTELAEPPTEQA